MAAPKNYEKEVGSKDFLSYKYPFTDQSGNPFMRFLVPKKEVKISKSDDPKLYLRWRIMMGVAEGPKEIPLGQAIPLEYNFDILPDSIDFKKGCYLGQELVARTHYRGTVRKRLVPFYGRNIRSSDILQTTGPIAADQIVATEFLQRDNCIIGLAMARMEHLEHFYANSNLSESDLCKNRILIPVIPSWWPSSITDLLDLT